MPQLRAFLGEKELSIEVLSDKRTNVDNSLPAGIY